MTNAQKWFVIIGLLVLALVGVAQQQYAGGPSVTQSGTWTVGLASGASVKVWDGTNFMPTGDSAARTIHVTTDNSTSAVTQSGTWNVGLTAGTNKVGVVYPYTSCGTTALTVALQALPTATTSVTSTTTCLLSLALQNTSNSTSYTVTITDGQGSPVTFLNAVTLNPLETREYTFPNGVKFTTGIKWSASNAAVTGAIEGLQ